MKLTKTLWAATLLLTLASSCQKEKPASTENSPATQMPQPPPPGGPTTLGTAVSFIDHGSIDPMFMGTYGFVDFTPSLWDHYKLEWNNTTMSWDVVLGYYFKGVLMYDPNGNIVDPLAGAVLSVRKMANCEDTRELEAIYNDNSLTGSSAVLGVSPPVTTTETVWWHDASNWYNSPGRVKSISFPKDESGHYCYILKVVINGNTYYQKIMV